MRSKTCVITASGKRVCGKPVSRASGAVAGPRQDDLAISVAAARMLADCVARQPGSPSARVWVPERAGYAPRVYVGNAGYVTLSRRDVAGHYVRPGSRATLTMDEPSLYPTQRRAWKAALACYRDLAESAMNAEWEEALKPSGAVAKMAWLFKPLPFSSRGFYIYRLSSPVRNEHGIANYLVIRTTLNGRTDTFASDANGSRVMNVRADKMNGVAGALSSLGYKLVGASGR